MDDRFPLARGSFEPLVSLREEFDSYQLLREGLSANLVAQIQALGYRVDSVNCVAIAQGSHILIDDVSLGACEATSSEGEPLALALLDSELVADLLQSCDSAQLFTIGLRADYSLMLCLSLPEIIDDLPGTWALMRRVGNRLRAADSACIVAAFALAAWQNHTRWCARCGNTLAATAGGWTLTCKSCDHIEYPRQDPAIIVVVTDAHDRLLLAHNTAWRSTLMSLPAGFVDAGESPERTVKRELLEEVGLDVTDITWKGSQPWPFPRSLMLAYSATLTPASPTTPNPDLVEIDRAKFFSREEYVEAIRSGVLEAPGPTAIARVLIEEWLGQPLPELRPRSDRDSAD